MKNLVRAIILLLSIAGFAAIADSNLDSAEPTAQGVFKVAGNWSLLKRGKNTLNLQVTDQNDQPVVGATVTVDYNMVDMDMNPPSSTVTETADAVYKKPLQMGMKGDWAFEVTIVKGTQHDVLHKVAQAQ